MQSIPITLAAPEMVLAKPIRASDNPSAMTICGKGVKLTESLIDRLREMGFQSITVEGHPVKMDGEATLDDMLAALDKRFRRVKDDPIMMKLKEIYRKQIKQSMENGGGENGSGENSSRK